MALNKFMHPRNMYKNPPDFAKLTNMYPEFAEIVTKVLYLFIGYVLYYALFRSKLIKIMLNVFQDVSGKVSVNFKDPRSLRVLTKYLLKTDFDLDIEIPEDRLVPTLPLRLNYILWIEDLLDSIQRNENVTGIDIGNNIIIELFEISLVLLGYCSKKRVL